MSRLASATIVLVVLLACAFGADLWLDVELAKEWGKIAGGGIIVYVGCLIWPGDER